MREKYPHTDVATVLAEGRGERERGWGWGKDVQPDDAATSATHRWGPRADVASSKLSARMPPEQDVSTSRRLAVVSNAAARLASSDFSRICRQQFPKNKGFLGGGEGHNCRRARLTSHVRE